MTLPDLGAFGLALNKRLTDIEDKKVGVESPSFAGTPTAPTPMAGDKSTRVATTEFVSIEMAESKAVSTGVLDAFDEFIRTQGLL